jgi:hypothetical protein
MPEVSYFTLPKKALEDAMKLLDAIPTRNGITSSEFIKTELKDNRHLRMSLSSELSGDAIVPLVYKKDFDSVLFLDRRMLRPFIAAGTESSASDIYEFTVRQNSVVVKNGSRSAHLESNNSVTGYEKMPDVKKALSIDLQDDWTSITNCATLCACTDPIAPAFNCVHLSLVGDKVAILASDTYLVFQGTIPASAFPCKESVALPLELVDRLKLFSTGVCYYSPKWAMLHFPIGHIWQAVKTECRKSFPVESLSAIVKAVVSKGTVVSVLGTQSLVEATDRISGYMQAASRDNPVLTLSIKSGTKKAILSSDTIGASFEEIIMLESKSISDYKVEWPLAAVLPILQYCKNAGVAKIIQDEAGKTCLKAGRVILVIGKKHSKKKGK